MMIVLIQNRWSSVEISGSEWVYVLYWGTIIGDGAIIGMGAVVFGEVPACSIIGSEKWRILGYRDKNGYDRLDKDRQYAGSNGIAFLEGHE
ncbi:hypothetical protein PITCH_A1260064 [uncultured Desulfobacterium sp.]|uniref:Acetyltransferase n=1 Tax=uncultured Desulfobacterium sp. TaxID=201089 RepID=A0A445MS73_9BACT|nr:hypothetical protein PITCH_A1260064 [uncultured Desulfobacterium sp.]